MHFSLKYSIPSSYAAPTPFYKEFFMKFKCPVIAALLFFLMNAAILSAEIEQRDLQTAFIKPTALAVEVETAPIIDSKINDPA